ncbi:hypothetical protein ACT3R7_06770 [Halomonas sp. AOP43-A1-21]|uniref:TFIIB-type domain-containing protein n=1 Tax=Halomonas colorata TaxID=2742615 RepID=A0ABR9G3J2_9GAMM|nr:hypothetical protein [Halomonas colorata]MBE0465474.1 hypothetical protein [Halomonas colorata]
MAFPKRCAQCGSEDFRFPGNTDEDETIYCNSCNAVVGDKKELAKEEVDDEGEGDHQVESLLRSLSGKK